MESYGGGTRTSASSRRPSTAVAASRAGSGAFAYDGMRATPLSTSTSTRRPGTPAVPSRAGSGAFASPLSLSTSTANFSRSLRKAVSFGHSHKKPPPSADAPPPRRALSSKENSSISAASTEPLLMSPHRRSMPERGAAASGPWEPTRRRRSTGTVDEAAGAGKGSSASASASGSGALLREIMAPRRTKEDAEKEEAAHRARMLTARLLQWRFANARMEKAMARATSAAENKLFYTWLRVAELRNIQAAKRIVAQRRRQKLKLARLLRPQLRLLASWEPLAKPHADATGDLGRVLSAACTGVPLAAGARADDMDALHETMFSCVGTVNEIEAITDMFYATAGATSGALGELARTIQQEMECLEEATRLSSIVTGLQVGAPSLSGDRRLAVAEAMQEVSLRANLMQAKQRIDLGRGRGPATPALPASGWCF